MARETGRSFTMIRPANLDTNATFP